MSWWNSSWDDRKTIEITENSDRTLSNYPVSFSIDTETLIDDGKMENDCSDLRFVDSDDSTELDHWIKSGCNTSSTELLVNVPDISAGSAEDIYAYYDNSQASQTSSFSNTVPSGTFTSGGYTRDQFVGMKWNGGNVDCFVDANFDPTADKPHASSTLGSSNWDSGGFWKSIDTTNSGVYGSYSQYQVDFDSVWGSDQSNSEAFIGAYVWSPDARGVDISTGSDDTRKIWVNGNLVHQECDDQGLTVDDSTFSTSLNQGRNLVLMMVNEDSGGWGGQWRISSGNSGLRYSVDRAEPEPTVEIGVPDVFNPQPFDGEENISLDSSFSVNVSDPDGEKLNVSFKAQEKCPQGWTRIGESCFEESSNTRSWTDSLNYCSSQGAGLATIESEEENTKITEEFGGQLWIGYNDRQSEGNFEWVNRSSSYTSWASNEPNNQDGEDCTELYADGTWNDYQCSDASSQTALCEKLPQTYSIGEKTDVDSSSRPSTDFSGLEANKTYYWYVEVTDGFSSTQSPYWTFSTIAATLCDFRGPLNECVLNSSRDISNQNYTIQAVLDVRSETSLEALSGQGLIEVANNTIFSGLWTGSFKVEAEKIIIKDGAHFKPENDRIILKRVS